MSYNMYVCLYYYYSVYKVDYRGAAAPKKAELIANILLSTAKNTKSLETSATKEYYFA